MFSWVPRHHRSSWNKLAHTLAKEAAHRSSWNILAHTLAKEADANEGFSSTFIPFPLFKITAKKRLTSKWLLQWNITDVGRWTYSFLTIVPTNFYINNRFIILFHTNNECPIPVILVQNWENNFTIVCLRSTLHLTRLCATMHIEFCVPC